ncbi:PREDICTED: uncharacterized protein LOC107329635 [Acropora digitifera]|uniref:uncharacterized protein LOC107329635 n=1 Tax=Acropora digitifera TaxID=70779 RepID=UPI00077ADAC3|nr:PREDICTED: uncharacterized protein LOC107329635 [Acropora digitifera]
MSATTSILRELFTKYGLPVDCVCDNGSQLSSEEFAHFLKLNDVKHVNFVYYHAASSGVAECMVLLFKNHMKASKGNKMSGQHYIPNFLPTYRATRHPTTGRTPANLFLGHELPTSLTLLCSKVEGKVMASEAKQTEAAPDTKFGEFYPGDRVLVKDLRKE